VGSGAFGGTKLSHGVPGFVPPNSKPARAADVGADRSWAGSATAVASDPGAGNSNSSMQGTNWSEELGR
jgi:hypothetical protein